MQTRKPGASAPHSHQRGPHVVKSGLLDELPRGREAAVEESKAVEPFDQFARIQERMDHEGDGFGASILGS